MRTLFFFGFLAAAGCTPAPAVPGAYTFTGEPALKLGETTLPSGFIDAISSQIPPEHLARMKAEGQYEPFLKQMAQAHVLYERAIAEKLHESPEVQARLAMSARTTLAQEVVRRTIDGAVTEESLRAMYEKQAARYKVDERKVRVIRLKDEAAAAEVVGLLDAGGDFGAIATERSDDVATASRGGDMGWVDRRRLPPQLGEVVYTTAVGSRGGPVVTPRGVFVFEVLEGRTERPFDEVRSELEQAVKQEAVGALYEALDRDHPFQNLAAEPPPAPAE